MNLRKFIASSLLLVIGHILHRISPPLLMGMRPDFLLAMMFVSIILSDDYKLATVIGLTAGLLTAATTTFPGGEIANIVDKFITCQVAFLIHKALNKNIKGITKMFIVAIVGTLVSGFAFLTTALLVAGLPTSYKTLVFTVVLPATAINTVVSMVSYKAVASAIKHSRINL